MIQSGEIISFAYGRANRDDNPLVLVVDVDATYLRGINLHYLPFAQVARIISGRAGNKTSYADISGMAAVAASFRVYRRSAIGKTKKIQWKRLVSKLREMPGMDPSARQNMSDTIEKYLSSVQPSSSLPFLIAQAARNPESL